jgi:WD40 repeat protein
LSPKKRSAALRIKQSLFGHDEKITCVALSTDFGIVVSGSSDKTCNQYTTEGRFLRTLYHSGQVDIVKISSLGNIVTYCKDTSQLASYGILTNIRFKLLTFKDINGQLEKVSNRGTTKLTCIVLTKDGKHLITGDEIGTIIVRRLYDLEIIREVAGTI